MEKTKRITVVLLKIVRLHITDFFSLLNINALKNYSNDCEDCYKKKASGTIPIREIKRILGDCDFTVTHKI